MKRLLVLLALLGVLAAPGRLAAQQIPVGVGGQLSAAVHVPIVVPVVVDMSARPERLGSFALRIQWNPAVLSLSGGSDGSFGGVQVNQDSLALGVARLAGVNAAGVSGRITLVNIQLVPLVKDTATITLTLTGLYAAGTFADLDSLAVVTNGLFCPARGLWGDIDGDGAANSRDALIALSNAVGLDVSAFDIGLGDVNGDGNTNATDALIILSNSVGMDVSRFRVLRIAGGSCSAYGAVALSITPTATDTLVKGQSVQFEAWVADSVTGALQAVPNPTWKSSAPLVLVVGPDGHGTARDSGTVVVTALRGTRDSVRTTVHIVARRTSHWVDVAALNAKNRLGTAALPFGTIDEGKQFAQDGDTLRIRLGSYEIQNGTLTLDRPIVLIGDTAADGSRPVLVPDSGQGGFSGDAIDISGPGRRELQYLAFNGATYGVYVDGTDCVLLRGVRMQVFVSGVYSDAPAHCIRIERSVILGPDVPYVDAPPVHGTAPRIAGSPAYVGMGPGVQVDGPLDTLTIEDTEIGGFGYGVELSTLPDTTTIRRSSLHDFSNGAVVTGYGGCYDCSPPSGRSAAGPAAHARPAHAARAGVARSAMDGMSQPPAVVIESSRLARSSYGYLVYLDAPFRRVALAHNWMSNPGYDALYVYSGGVSGVGGYLSLLGDSIVAPPENQHNDWLDAEYLDSLTIDSLQVVGANRGYAYDVALLRMTNSTLRAIRSYGLEVEAGGVLQLGNDSVIGDPRDDASVDAFEDYGARVEADRVTVVNAYEGIDAEGSDSSVTVSNSLFQHVEYPVYWETNTNPAPAASVLTVSNSTFRGFSWAIEAYYGRMVADSNTFVNGYQPIYFDTPRPIAVRGNRLSASPNGIELYSYDSTTTVTVADNVLSGVASQGIYVEGSTYPDSLGTRFDVRGNAVTCDAAGATGVAGIELYEAHLAVNDNQVNNCFEGILTSVSTNSPRSDSIVGNTVTAPPSAHFGIGAAGNILARIGRNTVTGAGTGGQTAGLIDVPGTCGWWGCPDNGSSVVTIDSNIVSGGTNFGIRAQDSDSLVIFGNTVQNLNSATSGYMPYGSDIAGITVMGYLGRFASVVGNVVKHIVGSGIVVSHGDGNVVLVDSNVVADLDTTGLGGYGGSGIYLPWGPALLTRNFLTGARQSGVLISMGDSVGLTGNNIAGNQPYGVRVAIERSTVEAQFNWWGDTLGPTCVEVCTGVTGDSVSNGVDHSNFLTAVNGYAPTVVPAPRFLARARPPRVVNTAAAVGGQGAGFPRTARFPALKAFSPRPAATGAAASFDPAAQRRAARDQARVQREAQRAQSIQRLRARVEARDAARQAAKAAQAARAAAHTSSSPGGTRSQGVKP